LPVLDVSGGPSPQGSDPMAEFESFASLLGKRLGEMHGCLATPGTESAFAPETATAADAKAWGEATVSQLDAALKILANASELDESSSAMSRRLQSRRTALVKAVRKLAQSAEGSLRIRIHGDFHLGQVLVSSGDVWLVDFEGEPAKTLAARRAKASPWRDVAGLLRSFDYAAAFAVRSGAGEPPPPALLAHYLETSTSAFLKAYRAAAPEAAHRGAEDLLTLFTLEKAAYEVCYEAANRPGWLDVPLAGLSRLAEELVSGKPRANETNLKA
jgi:maltose alpha-D-glucosyltransferase / alpha-amylase